MSPNQRMLRTQRTSKPEREGAETCRESRFQACFHQQRGACLENPARRSKYPMRSLGARRWPVEFSRDSTDPVQNRAPQTRRSLRAGTDEVSQRAASSAGPTDLGSVVSTWPAMPRLASHCAGMAEGPCFTGATHLPARGAPASSGGHRRPRRHHYAARASREREGGQAAIPCWRRPQPYAVSKLRYSPYVLDGRPILKPTRINIKLSRTLARPRNILTIR